MLVLFVISTLLYENKIRVIDDYQNDFENIKQTESEQQSTEFGSFSIAYSI